jgi:hypothetical protein
VDVELATVDTAGGKGREDVHEHAAECARNGRIRDAVLEFADARLMTVGGSRVGCDDRRKRHDTD